MLNMKRKVIVMGVSGCGKSLIGNLLAKHLSVSFFDGDDYHPPSNLDKMGAGIPLNDVDRTGWLITLNQLINSETSLVLACSSLKSEYREILREGNSVLFIYLKGDKETIWQRHQQREGHYFKGRYMLDSQFAAVSYTHLTLPTTPYV